MKNKTILQLNQINKDFYDKIGTYFDKTRQYNWSGWERIINNEELIIKNMLDVGCGNGRFYGFLEENLKKDFDYLGIDSNEYLLEAARKNYPNARFEKFDVIESLLNKDRIFEKILCIPDHASYAAVRDDNNVEVDKFDLITLFGVMHHIPGFEFRLNLIKNLKGLLTEGGTLVLSLWNFLDDERLKNKIVDWDQIDIEQTDLEKNDYLLSWDKGDRALRYSHYFDDSEIDEIISKSDLKLVDKFKAEGKAENLNTYLVLRK